jgi:hypothetical protein
VQHDSRDVGGLAESRIAHDIDIGEARYTEGAAEAGATGAFDIGQNLQPPRDSEAGEQSLDVRCGVFLIRLKAVRAGVFGIERRILLPDDIDLSGNPEAIRPLERVGFLAEYGVRRNNENDENGR